MFNCQKNFDKTARLFVYGALGIQGILGLVWIIKNITVYVPSILSENYIKASESLVVDDYMGILYALFLKICCVSNNGKINPLPVYLIQLWAMGVSVFGLTYSLLKKTLSRKDIGIIVTLIMVNPVVLQICCQIDPLALVLSHLLGFWCGMHEYSRENNIRYLFIVCNAILCMIFLKNEIGAFLIAVTIFAAIGNYKKNKALSIKLLIIAFAGVLLIMLNEHFTTPYAYMRGQRSIASIALQRFVWPDMNDMNVQISFLFSEDVEMEAAKACRSMEALYSEYMYKLEMVADYSKVSNYYIGWGLLNLRIDTKTQLLRLFSDMTLGFLGVLSLPLVYLFRISNTLVAVSMGNFTKQWYHGFSFYFIFFVCFTLILIILTLIKLILHKEIKKNRKYVWGVLFVCVLTSLYSSFLAYRGFDYRNVAFSSCVVEILTAGYLLISEKKEW